MLNYRENIGWITEECFVEKVFQVLVLLQFVLIFYLSMKRLFDFDEFQVLYAAAALLRGKALYHDEVGTHFPFVNIFFSFLLNLYGFKATFLLIGRLLMMVCLSLTLIYVYRISRLFAGQIYATLAVVLVMSSLAFVNKGIEIRHDVFNMMFNTIGVFYALQYLERRHIHSALLASVLLGLALASTQKAAIWNAGIMAGFFFAFFKDKKSGSPIHLPPVFLVVWVLPLCLSLLSLCVVYHETLQSILQVAVWDRFQYVDPTRKSPHPFPYPKLDIYLLLLKDNGLFYLMSIVGLVSLLFKKDAGAKVWVIFFWAAFGLVFYLGMKRPFYQSFLPTIPALGIAAAVALEHARTFFSVKNGVIRCLVYGVLIFTLVFWPNKSLVAKVMRPGSLAVQMKNVAFCLEHLRPNEEVFCFTQQQIFFDSVFNGVKDQQCGLLFRKMDPACTINEIIQSQCKVVIYDRRTTILDQEIQEEIKRNYRYTGIGHIFIPGFLVPPLETVKKTIWISGYYYAPTVDILLNGEPITDPVNHLDQGTYEIRNLSKQHVAFMYAFRNEQ